jgi:hypothetical protein
MLAITIASLLSGRCEGFFIALPVAIMAQAVRAILLASAIAATFVGRRSSRGQGLPCFPPPVGSAHFRVCAQDPASGEVQSGMRVYCPNARLMDATTVNWVL